MFEPAEWPVDLHDNYHQNHQRPTENVTCNGSHQQQQQQQQEQDGELARISGEQKLCRKRWWWFRPQKQSISQLHLFGLLSLLCFATLGTSRVATAAKVGNSGSSSAGGSTSNTSLRNIEDENGKQNNNNKSLNNNNNNDNTRLLFCT